MRLEHIAFVIVLFCFSAQAEGDEPFGPATVPAPQDPHATDWRKVQDDWVIEREILERCRVDRERCPSRAALQFLTIVDGARIQTGRARLGYVNRAINLAIRPIMISVTTRSPRYGRHLLLRSRTALAIARIMRLPSIMRLARLASPQTIVGWSW